METERESSDAPEDNASPTDQPLQPHLAFLTLYMELLCFRDIACQTRAPLKNIGEKLYAVMDSSGGLALFMRDIQECWQFLI